MRRNYAVRSLTTNATGKYETLQVELIDGILLVKLNRPRTKNAINTAMYLEITKVCVKIRRKCACVRAFVRSCAHEANSFFPSSCSKLLTLMPMFALWYALHVHECVCAVQERSCLSAHSGLIVCWCLPLVRRF